MEASLGRKNSLWAAFPFNGYIIIPNGYTKQSFPLLAPFIFQKSLKYQKLGGLARPG
jgi:hypothetical protein